MRSCFGCKRSRGEDVDEKEIRKEQGSQQGLEVQRGAVQTMQQGRENDRGDGDAGEEGAFVPVMEAMPLFEFGS